MKQSGFLEELLDWNGLLPIDLQRGAGTSGFA
jgi:hypothetical protein